MGASDNGGGAMESAKFSVLMALIGATLTGCVTVKGPENAPKDKAFSLPQNSVFWTPPDKRDDCLTMDTVTKLKGERYIQGYKRLNSAILFIRHMATNMASSLGNPKFDHQGFADTLTKAAQEKSYIFLDFEDAGGPSPAFLQKLLAYSVAQAVVVLDQRNAWKQGQRDAVLAWGRALAEETDPKRSYATLDTFAAIAAARMAWGALAEREALFQDGLQDFHRVGWGIDPDTRLFDIELGLRDLGKITQFYPDEGPSLALRINNEMIQHMVRAAEVAEVNGINAYNFSYNGLTLQDVIQEFAAKTLKHGGSHVRSGGFVAHLGWVPLYLKRFPEGPGSADLKNVLQPLVSVLRGISVTEYPLCFWGYTG